MQAYTLHKDIVNKPSIKIVSIHKYNTVLFEIGQVHSHLKA